MKAVNEVAYNKIVCPKCYTEYNEESDLHDHYYELEHTNIHYPENNEFNAICENIECKQKFRVIYEHITKFTSSLIKEKVS